MIKAARDQRCAASSLVIDLMSNNTVVLTLKCATAYEASVLYDELGESQ